ncbi:hypothetical protein H3146_04145 [Streptomyces sp. OF3]|uniref:Uncharacterized protein n=1 Tax=Streptomyces alkaliterrae TaxID=2213162 RepID=A0A7W3ZLR2_9ACTN|nr:hypothetical protein [Streptomyces alkaliterrae]MBB1252567.1 hypothetical protein [Streptomyces alkaliterrae]
MPRSSLYDRYQKAGSDYQAHRAECGQCTDAAHCPAGHPLYETWARLQDLYLKHFRR